MSYTSQCLFVSLADVPEKTKYLFILFILNYLCIYFWLCWVFVAVCGLSLVAASGGYSSFWCTGFSLQWLLLSQSTDSRHTGFSSCGARAQQLWLTGLVAPRHVGSSRTRAWTRVPRFGRRILNHCATREVPQIFLNAPGSKSLRKTAECSSNS